MSRQIPRRAFLKTTGAVALVSGAGCGAPPAPKKPNIVFLFSDTHRWGALPWTQTPAVQTPHMEAMRDRGVHFSSCYSNLPLCTPYRAILMTGRWPYQQGLIANHMSLRERVDQGVGEKTRGTLPRMFQAAGYRTAYFGKWHLGGHDARLFGWETSLVWGGTNNHRKCRYSVNGGDWIDWEGISNAPATVDQALDWLDDYGTSDTPFFLMVSLNPPHGPMIDAPDDKKALYPDPAALPFHPHDELRNWDDHQGYHAHVSVVDDCVGTIQAKLEALQISENTIFVYTSDHGGMSGVHSIAYGQKRNPEDESSRVPFLIQWPGHIPVNVELTDLFSTIDIFPTLCSLAQLPEHLFRIIESPRASNREIALAQNAMPYMALCPGLDFAPNLLRDMNQARPTSVFLMHITNMNNRGSQPQVLFRGMVTQDHLYAALPDREYCLYARSETYLHTNLVADPSQTLVKQTLRMELQSWIDKAETPFLDQWFANSPAHTVDAWYGPERGNGGNRATGNRATFNLRRSQPA
ncbi:MAG: sulfatase-like hydrolase/transferase [Proteobacteria bacterium]|nr:sulfatase-like hydrolase/transferase [Pseudomonadota bacterium]